MYDPLSHWLKKAVGAPTPTTPAASPAPTPPTPAAAAAPQSPRDARVPHPAAGKTPLPPFAPPTHRPGSSIRPAPARTHAHVPPHQSRGPRMALTTTGKHHPALDAGDDTVRVVNIGGMEQVGRNMSALFYKNDIITIDCGLEFADSTMPGVDYVIPDITMLEERKHRIRGMLITHAHLDHIGALQHVLPKLDFPPVYASRLTAGLIRERLEEYDLVKRTKIIEINPDEERRITLGAFEADFFRVNHSIPDSTGIAVHTPSGVIVHTGDYKFDFTPADGMRADFAKMAGYGKSGVLLALADSTNAEKPGSTMSESVIGKNIEDLIAGTEGRVILATFASLIGRMQHIINAAVKSNRIVFISGRSMVKNIEISEKLGYLKVPKGLIKQIKTSAAMLESLPPSRVLILCTGSQGEEMSALSRIASGEHAHIRVRSGDTVLFSSSPIPGNEHAVVGVMESLLRLGAKVITNKHLDVHVSGHGNQEDLKLMLSLLRPQHFCPVHGMLYMRTAHKELAIKTGVAAENIYLVDNGEIIECLPNKDIRISPDKIPVKNIVVDGLGVGDTGTTTLRERSLMAENGVIFIIFKADKNLKLLGDPYVVSRGFLYIKESEVMTQETTHAAKKSFEDAIARGVTDLKALRLEVSRSVEFFIQKRLDREPLILAFIMQV